jgi:EthD domain
VEKVVFLLEGPDGSAEALRRDSVRGPMVAGLRSKGASRIQVNVVDPGIGTPFAATPDPSLPGVHAMVTAWVDAADRSPVAAELPTEANGSSWHGYLVCEAEPLRNTSHGPGADGRVPGFAQLVPLVRPDRLSWGEWRRIWQGSHTAIAMNTQSTFRYVQNIVLRPLTPGAPPYVAVVEECFPIEAAKDLQVYFDAVGDDAKLARHMASMSESCDRFMDDLVAIAWTAEYLYPD